MHARNTLMPNRKVDVPGILSHLPLFRQLGEEDIQFIAQHTRPVRVKKGIVLFQKGDPAAGFYVVVHGQIKLAFPSAKGTEKVVDIIGPGQSFGEAVMFMEKHYPVYAQALSDSTLLHILSEAIFTAIENVPDFAHKMLGGLAMRLHSLVQDVEVYSLRSCTQRVIGYLLQHQGGEETIPPSQPVVQLPTSKHVIASRINITPETFSRILHDLANAGLITVNGREVVVCDMDRLRNFD